MINDAVKVTGAQIKVLMAKAVGGIYLGKGFYGTLTYYYEKCSIAKNELELKADDTTILTIPIDDKEQYINYAVSGEDLEKKEAWEGSVYFNCKLYIEGYMVCFNVEDKGTRLTWMQFQELINRKNDAIFKVRSKEMCAFYLAVDNCTIDVNDREIEINSNKVNAIIDRDIVDAIYNDSVSERKICYRFEFNNGMSDISINIEGETL